MPAAVTRRSAAQPNPGIIVVLRRTALARGRHAGQPTGYPTPPPRPHHCPRRCFQLLLKQTLLLPGAALRALRHLQHPQIAQHRSPSPVAANSPLPRTPQARLVDPVLPPVSCTAAVGLWDLSPLYRHLVRPSLHECWLATFAIPLALVGALLQCENWVRDEGK